MDSEGRIITLEFDDFYITQVYTPNAGDALKRLEERQIWDECYAEYIKELDFNKTVFVTGDFNVAHKEIDLANPKGNRRSAGLQMRNVKASQLLDKGFTDTFRHIHGDIPVCIHGGHSVQNECKINNSGWRIDYWLVSSRIAEKVINRND
ncbi:exodeoxyribonuclease III [Jeotgalicoccus sp. WY2]|uniref:exodeoxyribonuclease III n=1 Tax=Jeotgalicoccus sp. WY2 TaxID=2708346 RepID=UPI001BD5D4D1|nr:exodeoxyribonuclease III [Jeotgalicoccus sp. WY2]